MRQQRTGATSIKILQRLKPNNIEKQIIVAFFALSWQPFVESSCGPGAEFFGTTWHAVIRFRSLPFHAISRNYHH